MANIAIVYFSKCGATKALAEHIAGGIRSVPNAEPVLLEIQPKDIIEGRYTNDTIFEQLKTCDGIIFGSPTYMGGPAAQFKAFMDTSSDAYCEQDWKDKWAAGFTCGGSLNGEQEQTLFSFFVLACQHGMVWAGLNTSEHTSDKGLNRLGSNIGLTACNNHIDELVDENDAQTAQYLGLRVARLATK
ncbi:putative Multimeric flavodoxin WrbA [Vibrio nigripulchritudo SO65]|uniref:flavodoxin family protein n=1 Tax=Vibrio nigripulchritudo TaxID=28173 RepID=UPI0003B1CCC7|nr:flavodoxin family protein [Vibrio nigripulchritudo]CCN37099.1 putative Multimeric flavodoxin WrbA [Vibrio nigripulchritudo AM115]CCN41337.1 putative Multimeric flavodoxin WrbA [Vibrio nigripulchritudo FTn2]CCN66474.1 putative Multimeric flavodoxin WrbA [Vibrio nigripulchritudo POn4]CCN76800.1 putative Multimeric flavodoxin WrbA [Vibrio nigripulchritudo SO65]